MTETPARQPRGIPVGGRFAPDAHTEPDLSLPAPADASTIDPDGTEWDAAENSEWPWADAGTRMVEAGFVNGVGILIETGNPDSFRYHVVDYGTAEKVRTGEAPTLEEAKEAAKDERYEIATYANGYRPLSIGDRTPWGEAQHVARAAIGMDVCSTAGHGGWRLSEYRNEAVDRRWRDGSAWYEHDCDWAIPVITHWKDLPAEQVAEAHRVARRWFPRQYDRIVGEDPARFGVTGYTPALDED